MKFSTIIASAAALSDSELFAQWKGNNGVEYQSPREETLRYAQWQKNKVIDAGRTFWKIM